MRLEDTKRVYVLVCTNYSVDLSDTTAAMWHETLSDLPAQVAWEAAKRLCRRNSPFAPKPGEIFAEAQRILGTEPPSLDVATGMFLTGRSHQHPAVAAAAARCTLDPTYRNADSQECRMQFRAIYEAVRWEHEQEALSPVREALGLAAPKTPETVALPPVEAEPAPVVDIEGLRSGMKSARAALDARRRLRAASDSDGAA